MLATDLCDPRTAFTAVGPRINMTTALVSFVVRAMCFRLLPSADLVTTGSFHATRGGLAPRTRPILPGVIGTTRE